MTSVGYAGWIVVIILIPALAIWWALADRGLDDTEPLKCGCGHSLTRHNTNGCDRCGCRDWRGVPV